MRGNRVDFGAGEGRIYKFIICLRLVGFCQKTTTPTRRRRGDAGGHAGLRRHGLEEAQGGLHAAARALGPPSPWRGLPPPVQLRRRLFRRVRRGHAPADGGPDVRADVPGRRQRVLRHHLRGQRALRRARLRVGAARGVRVGASSIRPSVRPSARREREGKGAVPKGPSLSQALALGVGANATIFSDAAGVHACEKLRRRERRRFADRLEALRCARANASETWGFRAAKLWAFTASPYDKTLYLDADAFPCATYDWLRGELRARRVSAAPRRAPRRRTSRRAQVARPRALRRPRDALVHAPRLPPRAPLPQRGRHRL